MSAEICNVAADVSSHHTAAWYDTDPEIDDDTHHRKSSTSGSNSNKHWSAVSIPSLVHMEEQNAVDSSPGLMPLPIEKLPDSKADKRGRRKSWHIRADRKRRKGVTSPTNSSPDGHLQLPGLHERQKRPSWWNIFVPDHWPSRSRRASQDITRTTDQFVPWQRSKSRSVDHGFSPPFDLDSLRSKVEGRFDSVEKLAKDAEAKEAAAAAEKKPVKTTPPIQTIIYTVEASDTLTSVAARFDTTPSELKKLNRLPAGTVFPGQELRVPDKRGQASDAGSGSAEGDIEGDSAETGADRLQDASARDESEDLLHAQTSQEDEILDTLRPVSPKLPLVDGAGPSSGPGGGGGGGGGSSASSPRGSNAGCTLDEVQRAARFLKINVRHITDGQGVVSGVLLVTPNAVMFDPNVSDPLVIEHGPESYGVIAPMEFAVNVAIYHDIAHMRVGHHANNRVTNDSKERPEIYYAKPPASMQQSQPDSLLAKDETFPELQDAASSSTVVGDDEAASTGRTDGDAFPKAFDRELVTPTNLDSRQVSIESCGSSSNGLKSSPTPLIDMEERRRSILDHHWAVPRSIEKEDSKDDSTKDELKEDAREEEEEEIKDKEEQPRTSTGGEVLDESDRRTMLVKLSCHDSGIDIRDEVKEVIAPTKKSFSDADIILAPKNEFIPPLTTEAIAAAAAAAQAAAQANGRKKTSSVSFSVDSNPEHSEEETSSITAQGKDEDKQESKRNKMFKRLSYPLAWMEGLTGDSKDDKDGQSISGSGVIPPTSGDSNHSSVFSKVFSRRSSMGSALAPRPGSHQQQRTVAPKLNYHSMVSVDDMPELFVSFDKLIPRPARSCEDPPLYLRLRMGKPKARKIPKSTPIMSYGKKKMRPEYWFSVPRNRVDDLYGFLQLWVPHLYGPLEMDQVSSRGFELVESDTELWEDESPTGTDKDKEKDKSGTPSELADLTRESWEVLSMSEELRRALYATSVGSIDQELLLPDLVGTTEILSEEHRTGLCGHLPARAEGYVWTLVFSTSQHGFSLNSMYRKMMRLESPILMVIEDTEGNVFGALTSCSFHVSDHFYGTGESLLFRFSPKLEVYNWTGDNMYFIKGNNESLAIGAGDGKFGLWLDGDLYLGRTQPCNTYGNEPLAPQEDFVVKTLECWAFL